MLSFLIFSSILCSLLLKHWKRDRNKRMGFIVRNSILFRARQNDILKRLNESLTSDILKKSLINVNAWQKRMQQMKTKEHGTDVFARHTEFCRQKCNVMGLITKLNWPLVVQNENVVLCCRESLAAYKLVAVPYSHSVWTRWKTRVRLDRWHISIWLCCRKSIKFHNESTHVQFTILS